MGTWRRKLTKCGYQNCHHLYHLFQKAAGPGHRAGSLGDSERAQCQLCPERLLRAALGAASGVPAGGARHLPSPSRPSVRAQLMLGRAQGIPVDSQQLAPATLKILLPCPGAQHGCSSSTMDPRAVFSPAKSWHQPVGRGQLAPPCAVTKTRPFFGVCDFGQGQICLCQLVWLLRSPSSSVPVLMLPSAGTGREHTAAKGCLGLLQPQGCAGKSFLPPFPPWED